MTRYARIAGTGSCLPPQRLTNADMVAKLATGDEIVVCVDNGGDQRVPSTAETDPSSLAARRMASAGP